MKCKEYVFKLTSGQLDDAPLDERMQAKLHIAICKYCRAFTRNDAKLDAVLAGYKEHLARPGDLDASPTDS
jgi:hypothetical protein